MNRGHMRLIGADRDVTRHADDEHATTKVADGLDASLEELVRRARLQANELSLMIQRLERLRRDIRNHLAPPK